MHTSNLLMRYGALTLLGVLRKTTHNTKHIVGVPHASYGLLQRGMGHQESLRATQCHMMFGPCQLANYCRVKCNREFLCYCRLEPSRRLRVPTACAPLEINRYKLTNVYGIDSLQGWCGGSIGGWDTKRSPETSTHKSHSHVV